MDDQDLKPLGDGWYAVVAYALVRHGYKFVSVSYTHLRAHETS